MENQIKDLCLLLLYLTGWQEESKDNPGVMLYRAWKGYPFKILNDLQQENLIIQNHNKQPILLKDSGIEKAKTLKKSYLKTD